MWRLKSISSYNFMSFGTVEYKFDSKCYMIQSINHDNESQASNGGGKSSFADIIAVALLGYSLTGRDVKSCVSWNNDEGYCTVNVKLENKEYDLACEINRKIYSGTKSTELIILVNGESPSIPTKKGIKDGVDIREGDRYILNNILDIKSDDLLNYFLISSKYYQPFLKVNTDKKLEVIGRFTNTVVVDRVLDKLKEDESNVDEEIDSNISEITKIGGYIQALEESMNEDRSEAFNIQKKADLSDAIDRFDEIGVHLISLDEQLTVEKAKEFPLHEIDTETQAEIKCLFDSLWAQEIALDKEINQIGQHIAHIKKHLAGLITCPECEHKFHLTSKERFTQTDVQEREKRLAIAKQELNEVKKSIAEVQAIDEAIGEKVQENKKINAEIKAQDVNIKSIEQQQTRLVKELEQVEERIKQIEAREFSDERESVADQITGKRKEIESLQVLRQELDKKLAKVSEWIAHFEDFKFYLGNKPLEIICGLCNQYLEFNGSDLNLQIEGFKKLKSGEMRQSLNPVIYRSWQNPQPFASFSAGEQCRLNVSVDLAFQQLINSSSKFGGLDLYLSDELLNNLDSLGIANAAEAFNQLNKTILLVSHSGSDLNYKNTILIEKKNGISRLA